MSFNEDNNELSSWITWVFYANLQGFLSIHKMSISKMAECNTSANLTFQTALPTVLQRIQIIMSAISNVADVQPYTKHIYSFLVAYITLGASSRKCTEIQL